MSAGAALPKTIVSPSRFSTRFDRVPCISRPLATQTPFSSQPANVTAAGWADVFFSVNCSTVAGRAESSAFKGMNGEKASSWTRIGTSASAYSTNPIGYSPQNRTPGKPVDVQPPHQRLAARLDADREALLEPLCRPSCRPRNCGSVARKVRLVEQVPVDQPAVARQVELSGAHASDGHADRLQIFAAVPSAFALGCQLSDPRRVELLVRRHEMVAHVFGGKRPRDRSHAGNRHGGGCSAAPFQEGAPVDRAAATAGGFAARRAVGGGRNRVR